MKTDIKLQYEVCETKENVKLPVIIVAAGNSTRMGQNKQFMEILSVPVIARTLMAFQKSSVISRIILVVRAEDIFAFENLAKNYNISKLTDIVCGGNCRQASVLKGFDRISDDEKNVLIHDGARPLVSEEVIVSVSKALEKASAAACGVRVKDTLKLVDSNGNIVKTVDRSSLYAIQTPQGVRKKDYLNAVKQIEDITAITDDMSVMEMAGYTCLLVDGDYKNVKITTPEDIPLAENYLKEE